MGHWWNNTDGGNQVLTGKPVHLPLCPSQIPHQLVWHWTWTPAGTWWVHWKEIRLH